MESASSIHGHAVDSVVWFNVQFFSWWPCKVVLGEEKELGLESFGDRVFYPSRKCLSKSIREFNSEDARELVIKAKKKLRNKIDTLQLFDDAIQGAIVHVQQSEADFTFDFDPLADISTLSDTSFTGSTPGGPNTSFRTPQRLTNSSIYTTGTNSKTRKTGSAKSTPSTGKRKPVKLRDVVSTPCSDFLTKRTSSRKRDRSPDNKSERKKAKRSSQDRPVRLDPVKKKLYEDDILVKLNKKESVCQNGRKVSSQANGDDYSTEHHEEEARYMGNGTHSHQSVSEVEEHQSDIEKNNMSLSPSLESGVNSQEKRMPSTDGRMSKFCESLKSTAAPKTAAPKKSASKSPALEEESKMVDSWSYTSTPLNKDSLPAVPSIEDGGKELLALSIDSETPGLDDSSTVDSDEEDMRSLAGSESEDDELPDVDFNVKESVRIHELKSEDIVWIKYDRFPYWPTMVVNVRAPKKAQKSKSTARVVFFGFNDVPIKIKNSKKVALFGTKKTDEFLENGRNCIDSKQFNQAYEEACNLLSLRASKQIEGKAIEQFRKMVERRPKDFTPLKSPLLPEKPEPVAPLCNEDSLSSTEPSVGIDFNQEDSDEESTMISDDEEENDPTGPYSWENVLAAIQEIKPELVGIVQGRIHSDLHDTFHHGSVKDKARLKSAYPKELMKWPNKKVNKLVKELISIAEETVGGTQLYYVMNVLLTEATVRIISKIDNITMDEAANRL